jgi:hypothetical protein
VGYILHGRGCYLYFIAYEHDIMILGKRYSGGLAMDHPCRDVNRAPRAPLSESPAEHEFLRIRQAERRGPVRPRRDRAPSKEIPSTGNSGPSGP